MVNLNRQPTTDNRQLLAVGNSQLATGNWQLATGNWHVTMALICCFLMSCSKPYFPPPDSEGGWRTLNDETEILKKTGMVKGKLDEAFEYIQKNTKNGGLLVVRNGWLVYENYFGRGHRMANPNLASCGKSMTSIAVGILMAEYPDLFPDGLDQKIFTPTHLPPHAFPLTDPKKADIKLGHLLAFSAGIRGNNPSYVNGNEVELDPLGPDGWFSVVDSIALGLVDHQQGNRLFSAKTLWCEPGGGYSYATSSIHIASMMVRHIAGMELEEYIQKKIAEPIGWGEWGYAYRNQPRITHTSGGGGIALHATDVLRFCYMLLREGKWEGRQVVPAEFVRHATTKSPYNIHFPYSLQFDVNTDGDVPQLPRDAYWKRGSGGHCFYVVPSLDLVVWKLGGRDDQYSQGNTGFPSVPTSNPSRDGWKATVGDAEAAEETLRLVIEAIQK
jgi:CubicO group peptidase (beta-lactamase class C family)